MKDNKFILMRTTICGDKLNNNSSSEFSLPQPIDYLHINYTDSRVAIYSQKYDTIIIMCMDIFKQEKY